LRLFVLSRHAHSQLNLEGRVNGDPSVPAPLTEEGRAQADRLGDELRHLPLEVCIHTRFQRTRETAEAAVAGHDVPLVVEPLLDDVYVGDLDGVSIADYRAWKKEHRRNEPFPGGESLDDAARRYAQGYCKLLERPERIVLVVTHEIPIRYALNAADGSDDLDGPEHAIPNATPYLFDEAGLARAVEGIERITRPR
jgi:2,3-bisphosphoglycerate-dependent phosphoglycerate mutase